MPLASLVEEARVVVPLRARDREEALRTLVGCLVSSGRLPDEARPSVLEALEAREKVSSTALGQGIALPHATVEGVTRFEAVLGILPEGVPFGAPDGQPATIIVLLLIPRSAVRKYSTTLAGIARLLGQEEARRALRGSRSPAEAMDILRVHEGMDVRKEVP